jgi:hypothetical protein
VWKKKERKGLGFAGVQWRPLGPCTGIGESNSGSSTVAVVVRTAPQHELQNLLEMAVVVDERVVNINWEMLTPVWMGSLDCQSCHTYPGRRALRCCDVCHIAVQTQRESHHRECTTPIDC